MSAWEASAGPRESIEAVKRRRIFEKSVSRDKWAYFGIAHGLRSTGGRPPPFTNRNQCREGSWSRSEISG